MSNINLIITREFNERVRKKSFIVSTILVPLLLVLLISVPSILMFFAKSELKVIEVIDESGVIFDNFRGNAEVEFLSSERTLEQARADREHFGVLYVGEDILTNNSNVRLYTNGASSVMLESRITSIIEDVIESERLKGYNIENLNQILSDVKASVSMQTIRNDRDQASESTSSADVAMGIGYVLGFVLYFFLLLYGSMVMTSVIEEKGSRVLDVLVSSVRPFDLMMGKILGIALVALAQIAIWLVLIVSLMVVVVPLVMPDDIMQSVAMVQAGAAEIPSTIDVEMVTMIAAVTDMGYVAQIAIYALLFLIGGYLLYSAMYAAVGSSVDTVADAQNLQLPIMLPIILATIIQVMVAKDPNMTLVKVFSIIPFTSPILMMARIPHGIPTWEIVASLVVLYASFVAMVWLASKIYRVGIFMHGKKPTLLELWRWSKYKY